MEKRKLERKLTLNRETLHRLSVRELVRVAGGGPTNGAPCDRSVETNCASCACPVEP